MDIEEIYGKPRTVTAISVGGFKSFAEDQRVEIRPLTLLAGANSSGKSSLMQPLLLLKQTLEASYDPGPLMLDGPHVRFSNAEQILARIGKSICVTEFRVGFETNKNDVILNAFRSSEDQGLDLVRSDLKISGRAVALHAGAKDLALDVVENLNPLFFDLVPNFLAKTKLLWQVVRSRCFLSVSPQGVVESLVDRTQEEIFGSLLQKIIHVPGLRGNPERSYNTSAVGDFFPGTFENYVASILMSWQRSAKKKLDSLNQNLESLGLTSRVEANPLDATRVELLVGRLPTTAGSDNGDLVNIVDVGFGVSQVLPVIVALLTAQSGQLVYIEQPELHLHPRAQQALASVLADAANRGVRVVAETHSAILLRAVQTLVVQDKLDPANVILHWFQRDKLGATKVTSAELDERGAYGDWPEDFGEVEAAVDNAYLDAVEAKAFPKKTKHARK
jgi:predicted ATPase